MTKDKLYILVKIYRLFSKRVNTIHCSDVLNVVQRDSHSNLRGTELQS